MTDEQTVTNTKILNRIYEVSNPKERPMNESPMQGPTPQEGCENRLGSEASSTKADAPFSIDKITSLMANESLVKSDNIDSSNILTDEQHNKYIMESCLHAMKNLPWRQHPSPAALPVAALCFAHGSCSDVASQRKFLETVCSTYDIKLELSLDRHIGPATALQSAIGYLPNSVLGRIQIPIIRETLGPARHAALEWEYNFSDALAELTGYSRDELTKYMNGGHGRLFHHEDWGAFVHRMFRVNQPPYSDSQIVRVRRKDGRYVRCLHIFNITNCPSSHLSSVVQMFVPI